MGKLEKDCCSKRHGRMGPKGHILIFNSLGCKGRVEVGKIQQFVDPGDNKKNISMERVSWIGLEIPGSHIQEAR